jgi:hypothetical protein
MDHTNLIELLQTSKIILSSGKSNPNTKKILNNNLLLKELIWSNTSFIQDNDIASIRERLFCVKHNITSLVLCKHCNSPVKFENGEYNTYCGSSCANLATKVDREDTNISKYGYSHPMKSQECLDKSKQTNMELYGSEWHQQSIDGKRQRGSTLIDRYGVDTPFASSDIRRKSKATIIDRYGVDTPIKNIDIREKIKSTTLERYGVDHISRSDKVRSSIIQTNNEKYGVDYPLQNADVLNTTRQSLYERYGVNYPGQSNDIRNRSITTIVERYGYETVLSHPEIQSKIKQTNVSLYGVQYYNQRNMLDVLECLSDYDWLYEQYCTLSKTATQISNELNIDDTTVCNYLRKAEIQIRSSTQYSYMCINWLDSIMESNDIYIQHALNGGEYQIPETRYKADGYCAETNTIYEFHGDLFHGNPHLFDAQHCCHPFNDEITAGELYNKTLTKEDKIRELGYNLVTIWEYDYIISLM